MDIYFDAPQNEEKMQKSNTSDKDVDAESDMYYLINKILIYDLLYLLEDKKSKISFLILPLVITTL
jgi:hypothetical protein